MAAPRWSWSDGILRLHCVAVERYSAWTTLHSFVRRCSAHAEAAGAMYESDTTCPTLDYVLHTAARARSDQQQMLDWWGPIIHEV